MSITINGKVIDLDAYERPPIHKRAKTNSRRRKRQTDEGAVAEPTVDTSQGSEPPPPIDEDFVTPQ